RWRRRGSIHGAEHSSMGTTPHSAPVGASIASRCRDPPAPFPDAPDEVPPMTTIAPDRRTFLKTLGVTAAAGLGTLAIAPRASAADDVVLPTTYLQQPNFFYCGPTAVSIALSAKVAPPSLDTLAAELATTNAGTNFGAVSPVLTAR